jgi:hypothetical protein
MQDQEHFVKLLVDSGLSLIPITEKEKKPHWVLGKTHDLLTRRATNEEIKHWIAVGVNSWGVAGGAVSNNLVTLDFDEKHYEGLYDRWYARLAEDQKEIVAQSFLNSTRNNGKHLRYRTETPQPTIKLARRVEFNKETKKEEIVTTAETKAEGGYALIPPTTGYTTIHGDLNNLPLVTDEMHEEFIDILRTFNEVEDMPATEFEWRPNNLVTGDRPGDRLNALASWKEILEPHGWIEESKNYWRRPGKKEGEGISATTNWNEYPMFYVFSSAAAPFTENKGYSKFHSFALLSYQGDFKAAAKKAAELFPLPQQDSKNGSSSEANDFLASLLNNENVTLFHDEQGDGYLSLEIDGHQEIWPCKSRTLKKWLAKEIYLLRKRPPGSEALKSVLGVLEGTACYSAAEHKLSNRMAWGENGSLWYDLTNKDWQAVRVDQSGWNLVDKPPILFRRYSHNKAQIIPANEGGDVSLLLKYVNIRNEEHRLLLLVFLVSCFIPEFPHPLLIIFGSQGSAKSTLSKLLRWIIDPSVIEVASMPESLKELIQTLAHHAFLFFDNVSYVSEQVSDILCKAVTGGGFPKRELYSDDDDIIYSFMRSIGINGINLVATRPDLLERSILLELERIEPSDRKQEKDIMQSFQNDLPSILGGVFDVLVKAMRIQPTIKVDSLPRMADFAVWGCAIAQALGYSQKDFLVAYTNNIAKQNETVLNENVVASAVVSFMETKEEWTGTATELLHDLTEQAAFDRIDTYEKYWPKASNSLTKKLNELKVNLKEVGILFTSIAGNTRTITLRKVSQVVDDDGTDDVSGDLLGEVSHD